MNLIKGTCYGAIKNFIEKMNEKNKKLLNKVLQLCTSVFEGIPPWRPLVLPGCEIFGRQGSLWPQKSPLHWRGSWSPVPAVSVRPVEPRSGPGGPRSPSAVGPVSRCSPVGGSGTPPGIGPGHSGAPTTTQTTTSLTGILYPGLSLPCGFFCVYLHL